MLTFIHSNAAAVTGSSLTIDRKFLLGMLAYARALREPMLTIHPAACADDLVMDPVTVALRELPYRMLVLSAGASGGISPSSRAKLVEAIESSRLVYGGGFGAHAICRRRGVPYVPMVEYDLQTQLVTTTSAVRNPVRKLVRALRCVSGYLRQVSDFRHAAMLHCNGYPTYFEMESINARRLLYFDSRMSADEVISEELLEGRLTETGHASRPLRLLYSGRYEPMKGAVDAVKSAVAALERGLDIEMHCYGQGSQFDDMQRIANARGRSRVHVHNAVPYAELVTLSRKFDVFVCCHVQNDPSCTYIESMGAGLPILGYDNRMWRHLQQESGAGFRSKMGDTQEMVAALARYCSNRDTLRSHSLAARRFALEHCFEEAFRIRTDSLKGLLETAADGQDASSTKAAG